MFSVPMTNKHLRVKPSGAESEIDKATREAWNIDYEKQSIKLKPHYVRPGGPSAGEFNYGLYIYLCIDSMRFIQIFNRHCTHGHRQ
jgi:hypothetical protein